MIMVVVDVGRATDARATKAADKVRRHECNTHSRPALTRASRSRAPATACSRTSATRPPAAAQTRRGRGHHQAHIYRAFLLSGELRYIYRLPHPEPVERLEAWLAWASRSRLKPFVKLARTIRRHNKACSPG